MQLKTTVSTLIWIVTHVARRSFGRMSSMKPMSRPPVMSGQRTWKSAASSPAPRTEVSIQRAKRLTERMRAR